MTQCTHESHANVNHVNIVKEFIATSCHIESYHELQTRTLNMNMNPIQEP